MEEITRHIRNNSIEFALKLLESKAPTKYRNYVTLFWREFNDLKSSLSDITTLENAFSKRLLELIQDIEIYEREIELI